MGVIEHGRLAYARGYGAADLATGRQIDPRTVFNLASMSKSFTAAAIALLVRDGTIGLEDDIRHWLPELPDYGRTIRVRHLLHHISGLRNHMALAAFQPGAPLPSHAEALALVFRQSGLNFDPGSRHQYESPNYVLLAEIVTRASGRSFERFLQERIFTPLGMIGYRLRFAGAGPRLRAQCRRRLRAQRARQRRARLQRPALLASGFRDLAERAGQRPPCPRPAA